MVLTYMHLCVEDWQWWWKSFFASGSVALYVFLYAINYLVFDLRSLSGPVSAVLYLGYSLIMVLAIMLSTGTIGFLTSFYFVHYLFSKRRIAREDTVLLDFGAFGEEARRDFGFVNREIGWCWIRLGSDMPSYADLDRQIEQLLE